MEVISIERSTYEELLTSFNSFVAKMKEMASRGNDKGLADWLDNQDVCQMLNISPSSFNLKFLVFPLIAFILGRIALIFQNRFVSTTFFRNFAP